MIFWGFSFATQNTQNVAESVSFFALLVAMACTALYKLYGELLSTWFVGTNE